MIQLCSPMLLCKQSNLIEARRVDNRGRGGRGVFAAVEIAAETIIERVPVILIPRGQVFGDSLTATRSARISWYVFGRKNLTNRDYVAIALGYGSLYNHSFEPNARYAPIIPDLIRNISAGEETLINYNGDPANLTPVEFDVH
jgi:SET domain-containing protein